MVSISAGWFELNCCHQGKPLVQIEEVRSGGSYFSQNDLRIHFGLDQAKTADVEIRWPSGRTDELKSLPAGSFVCLIEGSPPVLRNAFDLSRAPHQGTMINCSRPETRGNFTFRNVKWHAIETTQNFSNF